MEGEPGCGRERKPQPGKEASGRREKGVEGGNLEHKITGKDPNKVQWESAAGIAHPGNAGPLLWVKD